MTRPRRRALPRPGGARRLARPAAGAISLVLVLGAAIGAAASSPRIPADADAARAEPRTVGVRGWGAGAGRSGALLARLASTWGGPTTASNGEVVNLAISDAYPEDPAFARRWADELVALVHGPELATVRIALITPSEVQLVCGRSALACYAPELQTLVTTPEDVPGRPTAQSLLAHEYGHHVAAARRNPPWPAVDWGTKRWATVVGVCARTGAGELFPGDEQRNYDHNPGEAFAEAYRVLNERRLGRPEYAWQIVARTLYPTDAALAALEEDVLRPWTGPTVRSLSGRFVRGRAAVRRLAVATPLDGTAVATLRAPRGTRYTLELLARSGAVARRAVSTGRAATVRATVCGSRALALRVRRDRGFGRYSLTISRP